MKEKERNKTPKRRERYINEIKYKGEKRCVSKNNIMKKQTTVIKEKSINEINGKIGCQ